VISWNTVVSYSAVNNRSPLGDRASCLTIWPRAPKQRISPTFRHLLLPGHVLGVGLGDLRQLFVDREGRQGVFLAELIGQPDDRLLRRFAAQGSGNRQEPALELEPLELIN
jgi:hypothetical protein